MVLEHRAIRAHRRIASAPAAVLEGVDLVIDLRPPDTSEVRRQIALGGPSTTLRDVAFGIVRRLLETPANDPAEVLFLGDCLKAGPAKTAMPCGLLPGSLGLLASLGDQQEDEVQHWLLRTYGQGDDTPTSTISTVSHTALSCRSYATSLSRQSSRQPSFGMSGGMCTDNVPRWPGQLTNGPEVQKLLEAGFDYWAFDAFTLSRLTGGRALQFAGWEALRRGGFFAEFGIAPERAQCFLQNVEASYLKEQGTPYHNSMHAADVTQAVHSLLGSLGFGAYFEPLAALALVLSAVVHDMGHDGRNNAFHTNVQDDMALTYNDRSVLENYHVSQAFKLLVAKPEANLLDVLEKEKFARVRKDMIDAVLGTDMAHHFCQVESLKSFVERLDRDPADWCAEPAALASLQAMVLHAADISNPGKPIELSDRWTSLLTREFFLQGDEERRLGLPVSPLCDRESTRFAGPQVGFMQFIVRPTFDLLARLGPEVQVTVLKEISANIVIWELRKKAEEQEGGCLTLPKRRSAPAACGEGSTAAEPGPEPAPRLPCLGRRASGCPRHRMGSA